MTMEAEETMDGMEEDKRKPSDERAPPTIPTMINKNKIEKYNMSTDR
jgi:hypothetical protein